jgi:hypothetical protein
MERKICFTENKGQITDQHYRPRSDVMFGGGEFREEGFKQIEIYD